MSGKTRSASPWRPASGATARATATALLLAAWAAACTSFQPGPGTSRTQPGAVGPSSRQRAPTLPPRWTSTPQPTPLPTATPTPAPPTPELPSLPKGGFLLAELPSGFVHVPLAEAGVSPEALLAPGGYGGSVTAYTHAEGDTLVLSVVALLPTDAEREDFDLLLGSPEQVLSLATLALGGEASSGAVLLEDFEPLGEWSAALSIPLKLEEQAMRMDVAVFRLAGYGAYLFVLYPDGGTPQVSLQSAAGGLASRLQQELED